MSEVDKVAQGSGEPPQLLPCPWCGGPASIEETPASATEGVRFSVGCDDTDEAECMGYQSLTTFARRSEAAAAWNKRAPQQASEGKWRVSLATDTIELLCKPDWNIGDLWLEAKGGSKEQRLAFAETICRKLNAP